MTLYLRTRSGATHEYSERRTAKLRKEILAGHGGPEVTALVESGYIGFLNRSGDTEDFEGLLEHFTKN